MQDKMDIKGNTNTGAVLVRNRSIISEQGELFQRASLGGLLRARLCGNGALVTGFRDRMYKFESHI